MLTKKQEASYQQVVSIFSQHSDEGKLKLIKSLRDYFDMVEDDIEREAAEEAEGYKAAGDEAVFLLTGRYKI